MLNLAIYILRMRDFAFKMHFAHLQPQFLSYGAADARWFPVSVDNKEAAFDAGEVLAVKAT